MSAATITASGQETARDVSIFTGNTASDLIWNEIVQNLPVENSYEAQQPNKNPPWWPIDHRRIPNYRSARYHPEWNELTDNSAIMPLIILVLFGGCHLISVGNPLKSERDILTNWLKLADWLPRQFGFERTYFTRRIAGEW